MLLLIGEVMLCAGIIYYSLTILASRNPKRKGWFTSDWMFESFHLFFIMGFLSMGPSLMIKALTMIDSVKELVMPVAAFVVLLSATIFFLKAMRIKERVAAYDVLKQGMEIIETLPPSPPGRDHPPLQKAA